MMFRTYLRGKEVDPPMEYRGFELELNFEDPEEILVSLTQEKCTFIGTAADTLNGVISKGQSGGLGVFFGVPIRFEYDNEVIFNGYVDLTNEAEFSCDKVIARIREHKNLDWFTEIGDSFGFDYLYSIGVITNSNFVRVPYIVSEIPNYRDMALLLIYAFALERELEKLIKDWINVASDLAGVFSTVSGVLKLIYLIIYTATLFIAIFKLIQEILALLIQPVKYHYGMYYVTLFEKMCQHLGYTFKSSIFQASTPTFNELSSGLYADAVLVPEKNKEGFKKNKTTTQVGYPNGTVGDFVRASEAMFNAKMIIIGDVFTFEREDYGQSNAVYKIPDVRRDFYGINADEIKSNYLVQFQIDNLDLNTINRYAGTNAKVVTTSKVKNSSLSELIKGFEQPQIPYALGRRKNDLTEVEQLFKVILATVDKLLQPVYNVISGVKKSIAGFVKFINIIIGALNALPGVNINKITVPSVNVNKLNLANIITNRVGMLALSGDFIGVPKVVMVEGSGWDVKIKTNNETELSAETLITRYHYLRSMVPSTNNPTGNQKYRYSIPLMPFCKEDLDLIRGNTNTGRAKILSPEGNPAEIKSLKWNFWDNKASIRYEEFKVYTNNLQETILINNGN